MVLSSCIYIDQSHLPFFNHFKWWSYNHSKASIIIQAYSSRTSHQTSTRSHFQRGILGQMVPQSLPHAKCRKQSKTREQSRKGLTLWAQQSYKIDQAALNNSLHWRDSWFHVPRLLSSWTKTLAYIWLCSTHLLMKKLLCSVQHGFDICVD